MRGGYWRALPARRNVMCCGKRIKMNVTRSSRMAPRAVGSSSPTTVLPKEGMTLLGFLGRGSNSRPFYGATYRYEFGGKRHMIANVLDSDVALFLGMTENGKPLFERVKVAKAEKAVETKKVLVELDQPIPDEVKALFPEGTPIHVLDIVDEPEPINVPTLADLDEVVKPAKKTAKAKKPKKSTDEPS